jgi:hypothetical protein
MAFAFVAGAATALSPLERLLHRPGSHLLTLVAEPGTRAYAFIFG